MEREVPRLLAVDTGPFCQENGTPQLCGPRRGRDLPFLNNCHRLGERPEVLGLPQPEVQERKL